MNRFQKRIMRKGVRRRREARRILRELGWGWRARSWRYRRALRDFQRGWALGRPLAVDGILGPNTKNALKRSYRRHLAGKGTASKDFSYSEFQCKDRARYGRRLRGCRAIHLDHRLVRVLQKARDRMGGPIHVVSGYRCPRYNARIGGARRSQHLYGRAGDVPEQRGLAFWRGCGARGVGLDGRTRLAQHVDVGPKRTWTY